MHKQKDFEFKRSLTPVINANVFNKTTSIKSGYNMSTYVFAASNFKEKVDNSFTLYLNKLNPP